MTVSRPEATVATKDSKESQTITRAFCGVPCPDAEGGWACPVAARDLEHAYPPSAERHGTQEGWGCLQPTTPPASPCPPCPRRRAGAERGCGPCGRRSSCGSA